MQIYANGQFLSENTPCIRAADRGFRYGDGLFETVRIHASRPYHWLFHQQRLAEGLQALKISLNIGDIATPALELLKKNALQEGLLRIAISRGVGGRGYLPDRHAPPTVVIETHALPARPPAPLKLWLSAYEKISPRALPLHVKLAQGLNSTLARMEAEENHCDEALLLTSSGDICEATSANILWLADGMLHTPAPATGALNGSTRHALVKLSPWPVKEGMFPLATLKKADAVMLCNAAFGVLPAASLAPANNQWESVAAAQQLQAVLQTDMTRDTQA